MKKNLSSNANSSSDTTAYPDDMVSAEPIESIVEELGQQDVLPLETGSLDVPSETLSGGLDETGRWDEPIGSHGTRAERISLEDETSSAVMLVREGLDEAEEELRDLDEEQEDELREEEI